MKMEINQEIREILFIAKEEAMRTGNYFIEEEHLVLAILRHQENLVCDILKGLLISEEKIKNEVTFMVDKGGYIPYEEGDKVTLSQKSQEIIQEMFVESEKLDNQPSAIFLLISILKIGKKEITTIFNNININSQNLSKSINAKEDKESEPNEWSNAETFEEEEKATSKQSLLKEYSFDLTLAAKEGKLDPVVGRDKEITRVAQILGRRKKNNPIIVGEPGVGKSAIAEGLAIKIAKHQVPNNLLNKRVVSLDIASIVAGTKFRGQFEERIKEILKELRADTSIILFIDEIHTLVGAGGAVGSLDAANMLKPALSRGEIQCIGATTLDEYREVIEKDGALERRFQKVNIEPTNYDETLKILNEIKSYYEEHHNVHYTEEAIKACITLSNRYISDRCQPDKSIDVLDEAGARVSSKQSKPSNKLTELEDLLSKVSKAKREAAINNDFEAAGHYHFLESLHKVEITDHIKKLQKRNKQKTVWKEDIADIISTMSGVPVYRVATAEVNKLASMGEKVCERIIGQDEAVDKVVRAIKRNRAGLKNPNKPIGTFLFLGPTGVGKTELAKVLAEFLFDSRDNIIRIDMGEYTEKYSISRLIGAPPGYVGYGEGGELSEKVRRKPYSVVLLDEIEKAHGDVYNLLLQVLDEGRLTDSNGRKIDFKNTILIMTSNVGSKELDQFGSGLGFATSTKRDNSKQSKAIIDKALNKRFNPEFINRIDDQVIFRSLTKEDIEKIIDIELKDLHKRALQNGYKISITKAAKSFIASQGFDSRYGARPLKRAIQRYVEDPISEHIITHPDFSGSLKIGLNKEKNDTIISTK